MTSRRNRSRNLFVLESLEIRTAPSHHGAIAHALAMAHHHRLSPHVETSNFNRTETEHAAEKTSSPDTSTDDHGDPNSGTADRSTDSPDSPASHR